MKKLALLTTTLLAAFSLSAHAEETKLTGEATCAKCTLKKADSCQAAITVTKADGTKETYLAAKNDVAKGFHSKICTDTVQVNAEGTVTEKDGSKEIALTKIEEKK
jgi:hypothetical protein